VQELGTSRLAYLVSPATPLTDVFHGGIISQLGDNYDRRAFMVVVGSYSGGQEQLRKAGGSATPALLPALVQYSARFQMPGADNTTRPLERHGFLSRSGLTLADIFLPGVLRGNGVPGDLPATILVL
jgi:hypothetical protein